MLSIGMIVNILFSIVTVTAAGDMLTREQCLQRCRPHGMPHTEPSSVAHDVSACCASTPSFDMHTCHMNSAPDSVSGTFEYPVPSIARQNLLTGESCDAVIDDQANVFEDDAHFGSHPLIQSPIPPYLQHLSFRC